MSGFVTAIINDNELNKLVKRYKKIKKYMKSNYYKLKVLDKTETIVTQLLMENKPDD